jgi:hypothetical protein
LGEKSDYFKNERNSMISRAEAILSELLVSKCCSMLMPSFMRISASQPNNWCSAFQAAEGVFVTSFKILDI